MKQEETNVPHLKPVVFFGSMVTGRTRQNAFQQLLLLKALAVTENPKELQRMAGLKTVAEVYRTLDKMMIRREYHDAMIRAGIDPDFLVRGIKDIAIKGEKDADRLNAFKALLKSLGLDQYKETSVGGGSGWEDALLEGKKAPNGNSEENLIEEYDVKVPALPESVRRSHEEEAETLRGLYE